MIIIKTNNSNYYIYIYIHIYTVYFVCAHIVAHMHVHLSHPSWFVLKVRNPPRKKHCLLFPFDFNMWMVENGGTVYTHWFLDQARKSLSVIDIENYYAHVYINIYIYNHIHPHSICKQLFPVNSTNTPQTILFYGFLQIAVSHQRPFSESFAEARPRPGPETKASRLRPTWNWRVGWRLLMNFHYTCKL